MIEFDARAMNGRIMHINNMPYSVVRWLPKRAISPPVRVNAVTTPIVKPKSTMPSAPSFNPILACTRGMRETQEAVSAPVRKKGGHISPASTCSLIQSYSSFYPVHVFTSQILVVVYLTLVTCIPNDR